MEERLRVGFVSIEDASPKASWSGTPLHMLLALRNSPGVDVEVISLLRRTCRWLCLPLNLSASARSLVELLRLAAHDRSRTMKIA